MTHEKDLKKNNKKTHPSTLKHWETYFYDHEKSVDVLNIRAPFRK